MITAPFLRLELWSGLRLQGGQRIGVWNVGQIAAAQVSYALQGAESLVVVVPMMASATQMVNPDARQVVRICSTDPTEIEEWRIAETQVDSDSGLMTIRCDALLLELARTVYMATDSTGQPQPEFSAIEVDADGIWDGPITDALTDSGLTMFSKGVVEPTGTFNIDLDWATPLEFLRAVQERTGAELQVRNDLALSTYPVDILDRGGIGRAAPTVIARTTRNLLTNERRIEYGEGGTRVIPRGSNDNTSQGIGYAYWEVVDVPSATSVVIRDPRGAGFPPPLANGAGTGWYMAPIAPTYAGEEVLDTTVLGVDETDVEVADSSGFTVGDRVDFRLVDAVDGQRVWWLTDEAAPPVFDAILDRPQNSGVVNYAPNPFVRDYTGTVEPLGAGTITSDTASAVVTFGSGVVTQGVSIGDVLVRDSDNAVVGPPVLSIDSATQVTLSGLAAITDTAFAYRVRKPAPVGTGTTAGTQMFLSSQVDSDVPGVLAKAWRIVSGSNPPTLRLPVLPLSVSADTPWNVWAWVNCENITAASTVVVRLTDAATNGTIDTVTLDDTNDGQLIRVLFQSPNITSATSGVRISVQLGTLNDTVSIGPWGAQPAGWAITDVEQPRACDLWHEGTLWLQNRKTPTSYRIELADLAAIDGTRFPDDVLALGGDVVVDDREIGVVSTQRLVAFTRNLLTPGDAQVTLGSRDKTLVEYLADQSTLSVSDIALSLSKGLLASATRIVQAPTFEATTDGVTTIITTKDPKTLIDIGDTFLSEFSG
jgi:hypothetical protein